VTPSARVFGQFDAAESSRAFGHTGFTGTSLWIDPENDIYAVLLTNRVHPDATNDAIRRLGAPCTMR
jgi:CubicO group peptidase (beta-lactamase class C family)